MTYGAAIVIWFITGATIGAALMALISRNTYEEGYEDGKMEARRLEEFYRGYEIGRSMKEYECGREDREAAECIRPDDNGSSSAGR